MKWIEKWMGRSPPDANHAHNVHRPRDDPDPWSLDRTLLMLSPHDALTTSDATQGIACFGGTGAGKSSATLQYFAKAFLRNGFGGLWMTSTPEEKQTAIDYCQATGRLNDLIIIEPGSPHPHQFNFLQFESRQGHEGMGLAENLLVLMTQVNEIIDAKEQKSGEKFWENAQNELLRACCDTLLLAQGKVTLEDVRELIANAPLNEEQIKTDEWMYGFTGSKLWEARQNAKTRQQEHDFEMIYRYWTKEFARLSPRTRSAVVASVTGNIDMLQHGIAWHMLSSDTTVTPDVTFKNGAILLLNTSVQEYFEIGRIIQGIWKFMFQRTCLRRNTNIHPRPVFLIADEGHYHINSYDKTFQNVARRARCCTLMLTQNVSQLYDKLGRDAAHSLLGAYTTQIFHAQPDTATNEYAANLIGKHYTMAPSYSSSHPDKGNPTQTAGGAETERFKIMPSEFSTLRRGGVKNNFLVDGIIYSGGRIFHTTGDTYSRIIFDQRH